MHELFADQAARRRRTPSAAIERRRACSPMASSTQRANRLARHLRPPESGRRSPSASASSARPPCWSGCSASSRRGALHSARSLATRGSGWPSCRRTPESAVVLTQSRLALGTAGGRCARVRLDADWAEVGAACGRSAAAARPTRQRAPTSSTPPARPAVRGGTDQPPLPGELHSRLDREAGPSRPTTGSCSSLRSASTLTSQEICPMLLVGGRVVLRAPAELATSHGAAAGARGGGRDLGRAADRLLARMGLRAAAHRRAAAGLSAAVDHRHRPVAGRACEGLAWIGRGRSSTSTG